MIQWQPFDFLNARTCATRCGQIFHAFASQTGQQAEPRSKCKGKSVVREDVCFADMEVAVESFPVPA
jgi:hypothetical protein